MNIGFLKGYTSAGSFLHMVNEHSGLKYNFISSVWAERMNKDLAKEYRA